MEPIQGAYGLPEMKWWEKAGQFLPFGIGANIVSKYNARANAQANMNLAQYQYSKDLEMWNKQNDYNSPVNQMARFKDAGLNPNLMYGQGSPGNATQLPKYSAPTMQYNVQSGDISQGLGVISQFQDFGIKQAQIDNLNAQAENTRARTVNENLTAGLMGIKTTMENLRLGMLRTDSEFYRPFKEVNYSSAKRAYEIQGQNYEIGKYNLDNQRITNSFLEKNLTAQLKLLNANLENTIQRTNESIIGQWGGKLSNAQKMQEIQINKNLIDNLLPAKNLIANTEMKKSKIDSQLYLFERLFNLWKGRPTPGKDAVGTILPFVK